MDRGAAGGLRTPPLSPPNSPLPQWGGAVVVHHWPKCSVGESDVDLLLKRDYNFWPYSDVAFYLPATSSVYQSIISPLVVVSIASSDVQRIRLLLSIPHLLLFFYRCFTLHLVVVRILQSVWKGRKKKRLDCWRLLQFETLDAEPRFQKAFLFLFTLTPCSLFLPDPSLAFQLAGRAEASPFHSMPLPRTRSFLGAARGPR